MALMLRKACQPILSEHDLDAYHADLCASSKLFKLYTPCGKTFAIVTGVLFSSLRPTNDEIDFAVELLGDWLIRNQMQIDDYIDAFTKLQIIGEVPNEENGLEIHYDSNYIRAIGQSVSTVSHCAFKIGRVTFGVTSNGELERTSWSGKLQNWPACFKVPTKKLTAVLAFIQRHTDFLEQKNITERILAEMNTCKDL
jgi:hypothetical protein